MYSGVVSVNYMRANPLNIKEECKKIAKYLVISDVCINTHTHTHTFIPIQNYNNILVIVKNSKSQSPLRLNTLCLYPIKNIKPLIKKL